MSFVYVHVHVASSSTRKKKTLLTAILNMCSRKKKILLLLSLGILIMCEVVFLILAFSNSRGINTTILPGDTIKIPLPSKFRMPSFLKITLTGQKDSCSGKMVALPCQNIAHFNKNFSGSTTSVEHLDYNYLTPGSHVTLVPQKNNIDVYIGLFASITSAERCEKYADHGYDSFDNCCEADGKAICKSISGQKIRLSITQPSYYFLRCDDDDSFNCSSGLHQYYFNQTGYNFSKSCDNAGTADKWVPVYAQKTDPTPLPIHTEYFPAVQDTCVLATLEGGNCGDHSDKYFLNIHYPTEIHEYIVCISMVIGIVLISILSIYICNCWITRRKRAPKVLTPDPLEEEHVELSA